MTEQPVQCSQADDLDNLITDSLGGVSSALDAERRSALAAEPSARNAGEAVRELQAGPSASEMEAEGDPANAELFNNMLKSFQDESFQKVMADVLRGVESEAAPSTGQEASSARDKPVHGPLTPAEAEKAAGESGVEDFLQKFIGSFDQAVGSDGEFEKQLTTMMTSMVSNELICEPLQQTAEKLEPWLKNQKGLPASEKSRYESQLKLYKQLVSVYKSNPDPLPEDKREEVQNLLSELHTYGHPPEEVMKQLQPKEAEDAGENFGDFMKSMGLDQGLGSTEQDLLKKLVEDPEELTKAMKEMAEGMAGGNDDGCKQQ